MATRRTVGAQFPFSRVAEVLLLTIVVFVSHTVAKPQLEGTPFLDEIVDEGSSNPVTDLKYEENRGREIIQRDTSTPFPDTIPRYPRQLSRPAVSNRNGYTGLTVGSDRRFIGFPGPAGTLGQVSRTGPRVLDGPRGYVGQNGSQGNAGPRHLTGLKGDKGDLGPRGPWGPRGPVGPPGADGWNGRNGMEGRPGAAGSKGERGDPGTQGRDGLQGIPGAKGSKGDAGEQGLTGPIGQSGKRGPIGPIGPEGAKGEPGPGHDAACLAVLLSRLGRSRGLGLLDGGRDVDVPDQQCKEFIKEVYKQISGDSSQNSTAPDGQKKSPARTCKDLFASYPDKPTGEYWIDPNGGDIDDAILVDCDADKRATCVIPKRSQSPPMLFTANNSEIWYSEMKNGMQIRYTAPSNQINALQFLSSHAEQNVTYNCKKTVGYFDAVGRNYDRGLKLSAWNDVELAPGGRQHLRYEVISDGCQDRPSELNETVISYRTDQPARLPVLDVRVRDVGKPDQEFSVDIGEVCFR